LSMSDFQDPGRSRFHPILWLPLQIYKWLVVIPVLLISTVIVCTLIIALSFVGLEDFASRTIGTFWARLNMLFTLMPMEIEGQEKMIPGQSYVIVANHQSLLDIYVIYGLGLDMKWVMKKELRAVPFLGLACERMGHIIVDRSNTEAALATINKAQSRITGGMCVVFFAEGTRSEQTEVGQFKKGAFRFATELDLPLLPASIHNTNKVLPTNTLNWQPGKVKLIFHDPIPTTGLGNSDVPNLARDTREIITSGLNET
jgi:1-acyl-sn-glycerol-3-phosphate acyltransferase